ncbi:hypothetical protein R3P38DRAFT_1826446 [Favolaschia claudopus]|uniref:Uncharacterized protein n=1 Tax=Favolaschia claudopus TaxID=2862362 RepID=A0AAW0A3E2_9AGAR
MVSTVPLSAIATCRQDLEEGLNTSLTRVYLCPRDDYETHRQMEYLWGLDLHTLDPKHERSIVKIRKSMQITLPTGTRRWALVPTEETLAAMLAFQLNNCFVPVSDRKSFLTEFSAPEFEYIFVSFAQDVDYFVRTPGKHPNRFTAPYNNFPRVTSSANPFFVTFNSRDLIDRYRYSPSNAWFRAFRLISLPWYPGNLPDEFLFSCYPQTVVTMSDDEMSDEAIDDEPVGSDETMVTPQDEALCSEPDKKDFVYQWVQEESQQPCDRVIPPNILPHKFRYDHTRGIEICEKRPQWRVESKRGFQYFERLFPAAAARFKSSGV